MNGWTTKRCFDLAVSLPLLVLSSPLQAAVAVVVMLKHGRPILFRQVRPGLHAEPFLLLKFRTMRPLDQERGWTDDASRLTTLGRALRASSLDELPALWNVVRGDMSLVGPRPLLPQYVERYTPEQARRHEVRPGITGLAQVSGRNGLTWEEKFRLDMEYVDNRSLRQDLQILLATARAVLRRDGITASGSATMPEFMGSPTMSSRP